MSYEIKISGSGTVPEIVASMREIISYIELNAIDNMLDGAQYEDPTLFAEIDELDDEQDDEQQEIEDYKTMSKIRSENWD